MTKTWKPQQIVSLLSQLNYWPFCTYWWISEIRWMMGKQQVSKHMKKHIGSANWISCISTPDESEERKTLLKSMKNPLKLDKWHEKLQGSRYARNDTITTAQTDETWKTAENTKAQANWISDISTNLMKNSLEIDQNTKMHEKTTKITVLPKQRNYTFTNWHNLENCLQNPIR